MANWLDKFLHTVLGISAADDLVQRAAERLKAELGISDQSTLSAAADANPNNPANWLSLDYIHDRALDQLDAQNNRWESADARLRLILGLIGVVFAITIGLVPKITSSTSEQVYLPFWVGAPAIAGAAVFLLAGFIAVVAYWPMTFYRPPELNELRDEYLNTDPRVTKLETIDTILERYAQNEDRLVWKFRAFKMAMVLASIATGLFGAAAIIQLLLVTRARS